MTNLHKIYVAGLGLEFAIRRLKYIEDIDFFSVRSNFISPNEHKKQQVLVVMSEIKIDLTLKKKKKK